MLIQNTSYFNTNEQLTMSTNVGTKRQRVEIFQSNPQDVQESDFEGDWDRIIQSIQSLDEIIDELSPGQLNALVNMSETAVSIMTLQLRKTRRVLKDYLENE
jgi:capsular polysaccharide biosynthesis protein